MIATDDPSLIGRGLSGRGEQALSQVIDGGRHPQLEGGSPKENVWTTSPSAPPHLEISLGGERRRRACQRLMHATTALLEGGHDRLNELLADDGREGTQ